jgi:hypothetical protein
LNFIEYDRWRIQIKKPARILLGCCPDIRQNLQ